MNTDKPQLMQKEIKEKQKLVGETQLEQERLRKKEIGKAEEMLDAIGQEDEKRGIRETKRAFEQHNTEVSAIKSDRISWLNKKAKYSKKKRDYYHHVNTIVQYELSWLELPYNYTVKSEVTDDGVKLIMKDRWGAIHAGAFKPCGVGLFDEQACRTSVNRIDDLITKLEQSPSDGIYLP